MEDIVVAQKLFRQYQKAKERGIPCTLTFKRMKQLLLTKKCYYTGIDIDADNYSLDRVDNSIGYIDKNVVVCDKTLNLKKNSLSLADITAIYKGCLKKQK